MSLDISSLLGTRNNTSRNYLISLGCLTAPRQKKNANNVTTFFSLYEDHAVPRVCLICDLHPFLERWTESLIESGLPLRKVSGSMKAHGIDVSYQAVNRHKDHMPVREKVKRLTEKVQRLRRRPPPLHKTLKRFMKQRAQMRSWIKAEENAPKEVYDALHDLDRKIEQLTFAIQTQEKIKAYGDLLRSGVYFARNKT